VREHIIVFESVPGWTKVYVYGLCKLQIYMLMRRDPDIIGSYVSVPKFLSNTS